MTLWTREDTLYGEGYSVTANGELAGRFLTEAIPPLPQECDPLTASSAGGSRPRRFLVTTSGTWGRSLYLSAMIRSSTDTRRPGDSSSSPAVSTLKQTAPLTGKHWPR